MNIGGQQWSEIIITAPDGEVLAVISDTEIIEKDGVTVFCGGARRNMDFKTQLVKFRKKANMSIARLSQLSGVPTSTICSYEHGVMPTLDKADKLLRALGASVAIGKVVTLHVQQTPAELDRRRWKGCEMCSTRWSKKDWNEGGAHDFRIDGNALFYYDEKFGWEGITIKFCPMCGRPLTKEAWAGLWRRISDG